MFVRIPETLVRVNAWIEISWFEKIPSCSAGERDVGDTNPRSHDPLRFRPDQVVELFSTEFPVHRGLLTPDRRAKVRTIAGQVKPPAFA